MKNSKRLFVMRRGQPLLNKGFTLIELLAVLIILAIIAVIAVPIVLNVIKETKEKSYDISVENVMRAAKIYDLESELTDTPIGMDQNIYDGLKKNLNGTIPDSGVVYLKSSITGEKREIAFALQYGDWCYTKAYGEKTYSKEKTRECKVPFYYLISTSGTTIKDSTNLFLGNTYGITREKIESITSVPNIDVPLELQNKSWDVSQDQTGKVVAWYEDIDNNGLFEVYIGQEGGVKANETSSHLFAHLPNIKSIDLTYFDTSQVENMSQMFYNCRVLTKLDVSNFDTSNVTKMTQMFLDCRALKNLDLSNFDTSKVKDLGMNDMFRRCYALETLDISNFNTSKVTNMGGMFLDCYALKNLDVSNWDTSDVTNMANMFGNCKTLTKLDVSNWDTSDVTNMANMFGGCMTLKTLDLSNFNTSSVKDSGMSSMFGYCSLLENIKFGKNFKTDNVTSMSAMFIECKKLTNLDLSNFNTSKVTNMNYMFARCEKLRSIKFGNNFDTSSVTNMQNMFTNCKALTNLDISNFDTSNVTNMQGMFEHCYALTSLDLSAFNTEKVTDMSHMFFYSNNLTNLNISNFNTNSVTDMSGMFAYTTKLKPIFVGKNWVVAPTAIDIFLASATKNAEQLCEPNSQEEWCIVS